VAGPAGLERYTQPKAAEEVAKAAALEDPAKGLVKPEQSPKELIEALSKAGHFADAVRSLAHALPRREAVWWAVQCVKAVPVHAAGEKASAALGAAERWATTPTDDNRRAAHAAAETAEVSSPAGCAAMAAFFSEGSLAPASLQTVPPPPSACAAMAAAAATLAAVKDEPEKANEKYKKFLALGQDVVAGANRWIDGRPPPPPVGTAPPKPPARPGQPPPAKGWY